MRPEQRRALMAFGGYVIPAGFVAGPHLSTRPVFWAALMVLHVPMCFLCGVWIAGGPFPQKPSEGAGQ